MSSLTADDSPVARALFGVLARMSIVVLLGLAGLASLRGDAVAAPPGGPFSLRDGDGRPVSDTDFRGKFMLVYFGYTFCPDACPTTLSEVADALDRLGARADHIQAIFITVDPKRDTPAVVKQYVAAFSPRLIGLTGSQEQIDDLTEAYRVYHLAHRTGSGPDDYSIDHGSVLYLMGPDGRFIVGLRGDVTGAEIADELSELMP